MHVKNVKNKSRPTSTSNRYLIYLAMLIVCVSKRSMYFLTRENPINLCVANQIFRRTLLMEEGIKYPRLYSTSR